MMRIKFTSIERAKKTAKLLSTGSDFLLSACQQQVAQACGYRNWHDLEVSIPGQASVADQTIPIDVEIGLIAQLAHDLRLAAGDVQHAITTSRLLGTLEPNLNRAVEVRRRLFVNTDLPPARQGEPGWVVETKVRGHKKETAIIRGTGRDVLLIMRSSDGAARGPDEIKKTREALPLFIPWRLYFPYGFVTEDDGEKVIFSRDYHPMWRIRTGRAPERLLPWGPICNQSTQHFWGDGPINWQSPTLEADAHGLLEEHGVRSMPHLVDLLPVMIKENRGIKEAVSEAEKRHLNSLAAKA